MSAQLRQQLAQKGTEVDSLQHKLTSLDAELGRMAKSKEAARDRSDQLQQQLAQRGTDLHAVQEELDKLQKDYSDKCDEESELKSAQQAQQDAELAAAKQEFATRLAGHQELAQVATDRANELQERLDRAFVHQDDAKEQISERQMELAGKRNKEAQKHSAQLQKQLDQKVTEVESLQQKLTSLDAELGRMAKAKEADEDMSAQLQQQLAQKDTHLSSAEQELAHLRQELSQAQQSKHEAIRDEMEQMGSLKSQPRAPLADRDDAMQELTKRRKQGRAGQAQGRRQGLAARLPASGSSRQSYRSSGPSSSATPSDEPKARSSVFTRLSQAPVLISQASSD
ncbi:TPA: hypothetical protein ACH3X2_000904 [Trebouxia sp. C0005]